MRYQAPFQPSRRLGFTIVELLVALALVLFIMSIISQVFVDLPNNMPFKSKAQSRACFASGGFNGSVDCMKWA